jgi:phi13 family phage major tail protein
MEFNEYRGVRGLVVAEVKTDDGTNYTADKWQKLAGVQSVSVTKNESSETHYYDNQAAIVIDAEGADELTLVVSILANKTRSLIDGVGYDENTNMLINTPKTRKYFALGYIARKADGTEEFNICYKGKFSGGGETHNTTDDGTEATNVEYTFTAIHTATGITADNKPCKSIKVPASATVTEAKIFGSKFTADTSDVAPLKPSEISALTT